MFAALKEPEKVMCKPLANPSNLFTRLLELFGWRNEGLDLRVKRMIARIAHRVLHQVFQQNRDNDSNLYVGEERRKIWEAELDASMRFSEGVVGQSTTYSSSIESKCMPLLEKFSFA